MTRWYKVGQAIPGARETLREVYERLWFPKGPLYPLRRKLEALWDGVFLMFPGETAILRVEGGKSYYVKATSEGEIKIEPVEAK